MKGYYTPEKYKAFYLFTKYYIKYDHDFLKAYNAFKDTYSKEIRPKVFNFIMSVYAEEKRNMEIL